VGAIAGDAVIQIILGLIAAGLVVASVVTGWTVLPRTGAIRRDRAPRAFWIINALMAAGAAYLVYGGLAR
jgi:hypothetical protein